MKFIIKIKRRAAQIGSASALGVGGCWFESDLSECNKELPRSPYFNL